MKCLDCDCLYFDGTDLMDDMDDCCDYVEIDLYTGPEPLRWTFNRTDERYYHRGERCLIEIARYAVLVEREQDSVTVLDIEIPLWIVCVLDGQGFLAGKAVANSKAEAKRLGEKMARKEGLVR